MRISPYLTNHSLGQRLGDRRAKAPRKPSFAIKYPDSLIAEVKWCLDQGMPRSRVAAKYNLDPHYVVRIRDGVLRANVQPKAPA